MSKKNLSYEEQLKIAEEIVLNLNEFSDLESILGPMKEPKKSLKSPIEKLENYTSIVYETVFWSSRHIYLELIQNFLLKKINVGTFQSEFLT